MLPFSKVYRDNGPCKYNIIGSHVVKIPGTKEHRIGVKVPYTDREERQVPSSSTDHEIATNVPVDRIGLFNQTVTCNLCEKMKMPHEVWVDPVKCDPKRIARTFYVSEKSYVPRQLSHPVRKTGWQEFWEIVRVQRHRTVTEKRFMTELFPEQRYPTRTLNSMARTKLTVNHAVTRDAVPC